MTGRKVPSGRNRSGRSLVPPLRRQVGYRRLENPFPVMRVFSDDRIGTIHEAALGVLEELGIRVLLPAARRIFRAGGARVDDAFHANAHCHAIIDTDSPRQIDIPMAQGLIDFAHAGQVSIVTPFTLMGAMAPITVAGATVVIPAAGRLEGGLTVSYEKPITDIEVLLMVAELCADTGAGAAEIGPDALAEVLPES